MKKKKKLYEGRSKKIYAREDSDQLIMEFKNDAVVYERSKSEMIKCKANINKDISVYIYNLAYPAGKLVFHREAPIPITVP